MAEVRLEGINKVFAGGVEAVKGLDLRIADGEFLVLLGPSGCGKTTALRMIAGLEMPTSGQIFISDNDITDAPPGARDIAMVFQNYALYPHMTAFENIAFGLRMHKTPTDEIKQRVDQAADILDINHLLDRRPKALSGGERQRVALGRALVRQPAVFLFDEPLSNLDARLRVQMRHEIVRIHREFGTTSVYVTHDQFEAMTMGDRIAVLRDGQLQQIGTPDQLYNEPTNRFVAEFIGTPGINIIPGEVTDGRFVCEGFNFSLSENLSGPVSGPVEIGIRPEAFHLGGSGENDASFSGIIDRVESLGGEHHVYISKGEIRLVAKFSGAPGKALAEGAKVNLHFTAGEAHFFEVDSGSNLSVRD